MDKIEAVYIGRTLLPSGKIGALLIPPGLFSPIVDKERVSDHPYTTCFISKGSGFLAVGSIYEIEGELDADGRIIKFKPRSPKWLRKLQLDHIVTAWQANDVALELAMNRKRGEKQAENFYLIEHINALRNAVQKVHPTQRTAFKFWLMGELFKQERN